MEEPPHQNPCHSSSLASYRLGDSSLFGILAISCFFQTSIQTPDGGVPVSEAGPLEQIGAVQVGRPLVCSDFYQCRSYFRLRSRPQREEPQYLKLGHSSSLAPYRLVAPRFILTLSTLSLFQISTLEQVATPPPSTSGGIPPAPASASQVGDSEGILVY